MSFEEFNLNEYIDALEQFKRENAEEAVSYTHLVDGKFGESRDGGEEWEEDGF